MTEPWSGWVYDTTEADPLWWVPFLTARTAERDEARAQRDSARTWAEALERRLAEVRGALRVLGCRPNSNPEYRCRGCQALAVLEAELVAE